MTVKTTVDLEEDLMAKATEIFAGKTKREIITFALRELIAHHEKKDLFELFNNGKQYLAEDYDYKAMRGGNNDFS